MKRILLAIIFCVVLISCKDEIILPDVVTNPPVELKKYTLTAEFNNIEGVVSPELAQVTEGQSITCNIKPKEGRSIYSIEVNNVKQPNSDVLKLEKINSDIKLKVEFIKNNFLYISKSPWYIKTVESQYEKDGPWTLETLMPATTTNYMVFSLDGTVCKFDVNGKMFGGPYPWAFTEKGMTISTIEYTSIYLDDVTMIVTEYVKSDIPGVPLVNVRTTYIHK